MSKKLSPQTSWQAIRGKRDPHEAREHIKNHDVPITVEEFDEQELEWRRQLENLPDVNEKKIVKQKLRELWKAAHDKQRQVWQEYQQGMARGIPFEKRLRRAERIDEKCERKMQQLKEQAENLQVRSLRDVVWKTVVAHAQEKPREFIKKWYNLFIIDG